MAGLLGGSGRRSFSCDACSAKSANALRDGRGSAVDHAGKDEVQFPIPRVNELDALLKKAVEGRQQDLGGYRRADQ